MENLEHFGPNLVEGIFEEDEKDLNCPLMGENNGLNYWKKRCKQRQQNPILEKTCYPYCKANGEINKFDEILQKPNNILMDYVVVLVKAGITSNIQIAKVLEIDVKKVSRLKYKAKQEGILG